MKNWNQTSGLVGAFVIALLIASCGDSTPRDQDVSFETRPNVILIMTDDLGFGDLGSYGQGVIQTPNLDMLAEEGMSFTNFYAGSTVCAPSRSVLMTGLHTGHTHIRGNKEIKPMGQEPLLDSVITVAELMKSAGYKTGLVGKWGLGAPESEGHPNNQGFDYFFGYLGQRHAHNYYPEYLFRNDERVPLEGNVLPEPKRGDGAGEAIEKITYSHDVIAQDALDFIDRNSSDPFFLFLSLTIPHVNNEAEDGMEVPEYGMYEDKDWPRQEKGKAAMITRMDWDIGRIIGRLQDHGIQENTIVIFTSDNGPHSEGKVDPEFFNSNGALRGIKRDLYEGGIRVPLIVWAPGKIMANSKSDHISYFPDIMPTLANLAGAKISHPIDGIDMTATLTSTGVQNNHDHLYWEFYQNYQNQTKQAVRMGRWKAIRTPMYTGKVELYDLQNDPSELVDIAEQNPAIIERARETFDLAHTPSQIWTVSK